jgi:glycerol uptake facilitator-like aquaporin
MADENGSEPPCCEAVPKSTVSDSCVPLQPFEDVNKIETIRGRCVVLPSTNDKGQAECIPFLVASGESCSVPTPPVDRTDCNIDLLRKTVSEFLGTAILVFVVVGSGISGETYSTDVGIALTMNAAATFAALYGLILVLGPVSGAHFNPVVSAVDVAFGFMKPSVLPVYAIAQTAGAILGALMANVTYDVDLELSEKTRRGLHLWISEVLGTATLLLIIHGCLRTNNTANIPFAVAAWVGGGYFTFSSTIFANPAVTIGRMFSNTFAGVRVV